MGPISVSVSRGLPSLMSLAFSANLSTSSSWRPSWTKSLEPAMHVCPVAAKMPETTPLAAASRSASSKTMFGDLPPSSRRYLGDVVGGVLHDQLACLRGAGKRHLVHPRVADQGRTCRGTVAGDDVEDARRKARLLEELGELQRGSRGLLGRLHHERASGSEGGGQLPGQQRSGEFQGTIAPTTPIGSRRVYTKKSGLWEGMVSPWILSAAPAK